MDGNPTWGDLYQYTGHEMYYKGTCIFKEMDYDAPNSAYAEKLWSLLGKRVLKTCRIPDITLVKDKRYKETGLMSHIILDNSTEDLNDMKTLLFYKFDRQTLDNFKSVIHIRDLLECIHFQVQDVDNYKKIETQIVQTLLLDSVTNNADRHANNWSLVRDKQTNQYTVGLFDHGSSFVDMISSKNGATINGWTSSYIKVNTSPSRTGMGDLGDKLVRYLFVNFPDASKEFLRNFNNELEYFYQDIESAPSNINQKRLKQNFSIKQKYMNELLFELENQEKGGMERE